MSKIYPNTMIARAGVVQLTDASGVVVSSYQAVMPPITKTTFGDNQDYVVAQGDTWHTISLAFLGTAALWWVVCEFNRILDPFEELKVGQHLVIPSASRVRTVVTSALV